MTLSRRQFITRLGAIGLVGILPFAKQTLFNRPNIVVFLADDLRHDMLGFTGNPIAHTPHLDALAKDGLVFNNCFAPSPLCPCSRASILTGQYTLRHGVTSYSKRLTPDGLDFTYPILMRKHGYFTGFIGKWGIGQKNIAKERFDVWAGFNEMFEYYTGEGNERTHLNDIQNNNVQEFLKTAPDRPFLLMVHFKAPHVPLTPQLRFKKMYEHIAIPPAKTNNQEAFDALPVMLKDSYFATRGKRYKSNKIYENDIRKYLALVTGMDEVIGNTIATLKAKGHYNNTVIIFASDNGIMMGEHRLLGKHIMYEEAIRIPLLMHLPDSKKGRIDSTLLNNLVLNIDLAPTILDIAGIDIPDAIQGTSLMQMIQGKVPWRDDFPIINHKDAVYPTSRGIRTRQWKYIEYLPAKGRSQKELFDLIKDPFEENNLARNRRYKSVRIDLKARMQILLEEYS